MSTSPSSKRQADLELFSGWGKGSSSAARVAHVETQEDLERAVMSARESSTPILARGLGRSYGDAAQCAGGILLDCTALDRVIEADFDAGLLRVEAGISLDSVLRLVVPRGWFVPVTPGTRQVTVGGAIAADVHGKNHHRDGGFGAHVERLALVTAHGRVELSPEGEPELYWATVGAMGLTGAIAEATVRLRPIETALMVVDTDRTADLEQCMAQLAAGDDRYRYSVAWVDCVARGRHFGRAVISRGDHARLADLSSRQKLNALTYRPRVPFDIPATPPINLVSPAAIAAWNGLWYRKAPTRRSGELQSIASFFHPLDAIGGWNRLYGPRGFTQYQLVVPFGAEATVRNVIESLQRASVSPALAVLKRFGAADPAPLSFPIAGWTLALDLPLDRPDIGLILDEIDDLVVDAAGRVYLAKDGRLRPELFDAMYPRVKEWLATRERLDLGEIFVSDLSRRLRALQN
ncbi:MAG: FAD-binding oxidoreductase [Acidimicrobiales bacterium]